MITVSSEGREFEIAEGSHVYMKEGSVDVCKEWDELAPKTIQQITEIEREAADLGCRLAGLLGSKS